jgi:hypothetical protein
MKAERMVKQLSGNYSMNRMDLLESLNRKLAGWAAKLKGAGMQEQAIDRLFRQASQS